MQLKRSNTLATAAASLIAATNVSPVSADTEWSQELSTLFYNESNDRISDKSIKYKGIGKFNDGDQVVTLNAGVDTLTGASPTGAVPSLGSVQVLTSASGGTTVTRSAGDIPLDDSFKDTRLSFSANVDQALNEKYTRANLGISFSDETDYSHFGLSGGFSQEINNRNTTLSLGLAYSSDDIQAVGGNPVTFSTQGSTGKAGKDSKKVTDAIFGITQNVSKNTVLQVNYGYSRQNGYLNDPYKVISQVNSLGTITNNLYESRPDTRTGHNIYGAIKHNLENNNVLSYSARLHTDDWGINSLTADANYRIKLGNHKSIEPHVRYYHQGKADFYQPQLNATEVLPQYASSDYRLAEFNSYTLGASYRWQGKKGQEWRLTGEIYSQNPKKAELNSSQASIDANPGFNASAISLGVKF